MENILDKAYFICADPAWDRICPVFKKEFDISKKIKNATLYISALGVYEAKINGSRVGKRLMTPGWTAYEKRLQYQTYDVTNLLSDGENKIEIGAGHGWFASRIGTPKTVTGIYGTYPAVIAVLKTEYTDGSDETICTDDTWKAARSEVLVSQIYDGETVDARIIPQFSENARIFNADRSILIPDEGEDIIETERIAPRSIIHTPAGETVIDFGQNLTGCLEFNVTGKAGHTVYVGHAEILDKNGNFYTENYRSAKALITYTLKEGSQTYKARYTFYGFRYVRLTDWPEEVKPENFTAIVIHSDMKRTGWFKCGNGKVNRLFENVIWGQRGNFLDVPTDCPQRDERLGWTGDAEVFCRTANINFDTEKFFTKWLRDMKATQSPQGIIPYVVPFVFDRRPDGSYECSAAWGDAATVCPWEIYKAFGSKDLLCEMYPMMEKWVEYIHSCPGEEYLWQNGRHFGDWLGMDAPAGSYKGSTDEELIASAYFYLSTCLLIKAGKVLGYDMVHYEEMAEKIKAAYQKTYFNGERLISDTQTAYVITIYFGLAGDKKAAFGKRLVELIEAFGDRLQTGFVGTPYLLDTLTEIGRADKAYTLLLQEKFPSWLFSVNMGATTIWEHWDGLREDGSVWSKDMNSFNHYAYGSVASWLYGTAAGITPDEDVPAYKHFFIRPIPDKRLGFVKARIDSRSGTIVSEWEYENDKIRYSFIIPAGTTATVSLNGTDKEYGAGKYTVWGDA